MPKAEAELIPANYFTYEALTLDSWPERIRLEGAIEEYSGRIEGGENIFEVIPGFTPASLLGLKLRYAKFEQRDEVVMVGERFVSEKDPRQVGKLLVPHYLEDSDLARDYGDPDKGIYVLADSQLEGMRIMHTIRGYI